MSAYEPAGAAGDDGATGASAPGQTRLRVLPGPGVCRRDRAGHPEVARRTETRLAPEATRIKLSPRNSSMAFSFATSLMIRILKIIKTRYNPPSSAKLQYRGLNLPLYVYKKKKKKKRTVKFTKR